MDIVVVGWQHLCLHDHTYNSMPLPVIRIDLMKDTERGKYTCPVIDSAWPLVGACLATTGFIQCEANNMWCGINERLYLSAIALLCSICDMVGSRVTIVSRRFSSHRMLCSLWAGHTISCTLWFSLGGFPLLVYHDSRVMDMLSFINDCFMVSVKFFLITGMWHFATA